MLATVKTFFCTCILLTAFSNTALETTESTGQKVTNNTILKEVRDLMNSEHQRPVKLDLWHKTVTSIKPKIAILSHGAMGSAIDYSWLAYPLAANGWVVIGMNHFGESWRYGQDNINPKAVTRFWQRTEDVTFVINSLEKILPGAEIAADTEIVVVGHSSGGHTAAALAGVILNMQQMINYCNSDKSPADLGCTYAKKRKIKEQITTPHSGASSYDKRISRVIMLDQALGPAATISSLNRVNKPTLVVGSLKNDFLPFEHHAKYYATHIPSAQLVTLKQNEGHFVYLNQCDHQHRAKGVPLCKDRAGVDRKEVHKKLLGRILAFLSRA